jgi:hypothetical protein
VLLSDPLLTVSNASFSHPSYRHIDWDTDANDITAKLLDVKPSSVEIARYGAAITQWVMVITSNAASTSALCISPSIGIDHRVISISLLTVGTPVVTYTLSVRNLMAKSAINMETGVAIKLQPSSLDGTIDYQTRQITLSCYIVSVVMLYVQVYSFRSI